MNVSGRVQGVGFRYGTVSLARQLGIKGRVWNNVDGTVGIFAQGQQADLVQLEKELRKGPTPFADVTYLDIEADDSPDYTDFNVIY